MIEGMILMILIWSSEDHLWNNGNSVDLLVLKNPLELLAALEKTRMRLSEEYDWGYDANTWDCINKAGATFIEMEK